MISILFQTNNSPAQLFIRMSMGIVLFPHGVQKVFGWFGGSGLFQTLETFAGMGFPAWSVFLLMIVELIGPLFLVAGLLTRVWAFGMGFSMTICMVLNHVQNGFFMNWFGRQNGEGIEYHILFLGMALSLVLAGGGMFSVDRSLK